MPSGRLLWIVSSLALLSTACLAQAPTPEPVTDQETELGQAAYDQLKQKGEIVESSPLYDSLKPIADAISRTAQPRYLHPFKFFLVHESQCFRDAGRERLCGGFSPLLRQEYGGTGWNAVPRSSPHDSSRRRRSYGKGKEDQEARNRSSNIVGTHASHIITIALLGEMHSLGYSRDAESKADVTGSDICAQAAYNPWRLVWLFRDFQQADTRHIPQLLSDHPADGARIQALQHHSRDNAATFSKFNSDPKTAKPFSVPKNASEQFLPLDTAYPWTLRAANKMGSNRRAI